MAESPVEDFAGTVETEDNQSSAHARRAQYARDYGKRDCAAQALRAARRQRVR